MAAVRIPKPTFQASLADPAKSPIGKEGYVTEQRTPKGSAWDKLTSDIRVVMAEVAVNEAVPEALRNAAKTEKFYDLCVDELVHLLNLSGFQQASEPLADRVVAGVLYQLALGSNVTVGRHPEQLRQRLLENGNHFVVVAARCDCATGKLLPTLFSAARGKDAAMGGHKKTLILPYKSLPDPLRAFSGTIARLVPGSEIVDESGSADIPALAKIVTEKGGAQTATGLIVHNNHSGPSAQVHDNENVLALLRSTKKAPMKTVEI